MAGTTAGLNRPVTLKLQNGVELSGILHEPARPRNDLGVILLSPGVKSRVAPHRLYKKMAARFAEAGCRVLRFDFHGLGDSGGSVPERTLPDLYRAIQTGRYVADTRAAVRWMISECGVERVILAGLCGGAITAVLAAAGQRDIAGIIGLGLPVVLDGPSGDKTAQMTLGQLDGIRKGYVRKLLDPSSWLRLLTFRTDIGLLLRSFAAPLLRRYRRQLPENVNPHFPPAFRKLLSAGCSLLLIFSGADRLYWEFREKFYEMHKADVDSHSGLMDVRVIEEANHILTFREWQREMLDACASWLESRFGKGSFAASFEASATSFTSSSHRAQPLSHGSPHPTTT